MKILAIDLGDARTGLAVCDRYEMLASPLTVIHEKDSEALFAEILRVVEREKIEQVVVGYPKNMNNTIGERAQKSEDFIEKFRESSDVPADLWDERSTTMEASEYLNATNTRGQKRKNIIDAVAATIILESYMGWRRKNIKAGE